MTSFYRPSISPAKMSIAIAIFLAAIQFAAPKPSIDCGECVPDACKPPYGECLAGRVRDACGCCYACGRREGELCDEDNFTGTHYGRCGEHLECRQRIDLLPSDTVEFICVCVETEALCGADGKTYENQCQLTEERYKKRNGLHALYRGPCRHAPKIVGPPEDVSNVTGGNMAMSCEAMGWPIPTIEWRVDRGDGDTVPLPSDDPKVAVQSRGGPSRYEVTGWLQLLNLQPEDDATYWCIAKNEEGESSAAARVIILDARSNQLSNNDERGNDL